MVPLLSLISDDAGDRASLSAFRSIGSLVGNMAPMIILPFIMYNADGSLNSYKVFLAAFVMGILGFFCFQFMIQNTEIRVDADAIRREERSKFNVFQALANFIRNRPAVGATVAAMGMFIGMQGAATAVSVTFQIYFKNPQISGLVSMFAMIPILVFTPLARRMVVRYSKKELSIVGSIACILGAGGLFIITPNNVGRDLILYILFQLIYNLDKKTLARMQNDLAARKA